jgi:hypothetical protein
MGKKSVIIAIAVLGVWSMIYSGTLFEDNFDDASKWVTMAGTPTITPGGGVVRVVSAANSQTILKNSTAFPEKFTYSVKCKVNSFNNNVAGIMFCVQADIQGYVFYITNTRQYTLGKFIQTTSGYSYVGIINGWNSFISPSDNELKVSKNGSEISLFCNGVLLIKLSNSDFSSGAIGLYVGNGADVSYDHALVTDEYNAGEYVDGFKDTFEDNDIFGWAPLNNNPATVKCESGVLKISNVNQNLVLFTSGIYKNEPCTTIVKYTGGDKVKKYGINYLVVAEGNVRAYYFWINANRNYAVCTAGSYPLLGPSSFIHGTTDTLIVTNNYKFMVNGTIVYDSVHDEGLNFNAVGLNVDSGVTVEFDNFSAGNVVVPIIYNPSIKPLSSKFKASYLVGGAGIIYDIKGRKVATFQSGYKEKLRDLSAGSYYIVIPNGTKNHTIRQAIIKTK